MSPSLLHPPARRRVEPDAAVPTSPPGGATATRGECRLRLACRHAGMRTLCVRWERVGAPDGPVVFVAGGISAHRHVAASAAFPAPGWWQAQVGPGLALDTARLSVLAVDWIGADGGFDAPIDPADQADAIAAVLDALGIARVDAFVGASYGAMVGLQFAARHPARLARLVCLCAAHRAHPYASALRALQRHAVALGALQCDDAQGLALARQLALLTYRTPEEFDERFPPARVVRGRVEVGAEPYLAHCGAAFIGRFTPTAYLRLSESIDLHAVEPESIRVPVTVAAVAEDRVVPLDDAVALARRLRGPSQLRVLRSKYGHDAFLKEHAAVGEVLAESLAPCLEHAA